MGLAGLPTHLGSWVTEVVVVRAPQWHAAGASQGCSCEGRRFWDTYLRAVSPVWGQEYHSWVVPLLYHLGTGNQGTYP